MFVVKKEGARWKTERKEEEMERGEGASATCPGCAREHKRAHPITCGPKYSKLLRAVSRSTAGRPRSRAMRTRNPRHTQCPRSSHTAVMCSTAVGGVGHSAATRRNCSCRAKNTASREALNARTQASPVARTKNPLKASATSSTMLQRNGEGEGVGM